MLSLVLKSLPMRRMAGVSQDKLANCESIKEANLASPRIGRPRGHKRTSIAFPPTKRSWDKLKDLSTQPEEKRPIIIHVTSLSTEARPRSARLRRRPAKLCSGDFDEDFAARPAHKLKLNSSDSKADPDPDPIYEPESEPEQEFEDYDEPQQTKDDDPGYSYPDASKASGSPEVELADTDNDSCDDTAFSTPLVTMPTMAACSDLLGHTGLPSEAGDLDALVNSKEPAVKSSAAHTIVKLCSELERERAKNEELSRQFNKAKEVIETQCRNIMALEEIINNLRQRLVVMSAKSRSCAEYKSP